MEITFDRNMNKVYTKEVNSPPDTDIKVKFRDFERIFMLVGLKKER